MSALRICTITFDFFPFEPRVLRLVQAAVNAGYRMDVICLHQPGEKHFEVLNGVSVYRMPMSRGFDLPLPLTLLCWCWFLFLAGITVTWLYLRYTYDVIHVHNLPDFLVFSTLLPKLFGAKIILDVQDVSPELMAVKVKGSLQDIVKRIAAWQEHISIAFADHVVTVGWPFEELLLQRGVPPEKLTTILNSADPALFPAYRRNSSIAEPANCSNNEQPFILMYHGTLAERNNVEVAIRALALARQVVPQLRLDIQGQGKHLVVLKQLAAELGVSEAIIFSNPCPPEKIVDFVLHGHVGIIPYRCDSFMERVLPTKAYEFAWMQRPMIASNTYAIRSMFRPESIALCDPSEPESFAEAIIDLYRYPEKRTFMVSNAAEDYLAYRWENMATRYQQLLLSLESKQLDIDMQSPILSR